MSNGRGCQCGQAHRACNTEFQYAVKVVCGRVAVGPAGATTPVAPGQYWTAVNIHNPSKCEGARFRWKVTVGNPGAPGPISAYQNPRVLPPDRGLEIDCRQIMSSLPPPAPPFVKGYVVIESEVELDVVAVYSTAPTPTGTVNTFHTERVEARCVPVCEDLVLPLHTGIADWRTVVPTTGPLGPVVPVSAVGWGTAPFGSSWVSQTAADSGPTTPATVRHYELCFDLCYGYTVPSAFNIQVLADDSVIVRLNNNQIPNISTPTNVTPATLPVNPQFLQPGQNCFRVSVDNSGGLATGFALAGILRVARGKCPCSSLPLVPLTQGGGLPAAGGEAAAAELKEPSVGKKTSRNASKKSQAESVAGKRKRSSKK